MRWYIFVSVRCHFALSLSASALFAHLCLAFPFAPVSIASNRHCCLLTRSPMLASNEHNSYHELCSHCHLDSLQNGLLTL